MGKLTRRDFLKYVSLLGAISPVFNVDLIRDNLDKFTDEQLKAAGKIESIIKLPPSPYMLSSERDMYMVTLRDGRIIYHSRDYIERIYGSILHYIKETEPISIKSIPANWND